MLATQFFLMLKTARRMRNIEMAELCDIHAIPIGGAEWHKTVQERYTRSFERELDPQVPSLSSRITPPDQAGPLMLELFATKRRAMGYG